MYEAHQASRAPQSLTGDEQERLIQAAASGRHGVRNVAILRLALGTGLREHEIVALNLGDVLGPQGVRQRVRLQVFKGHRRLRASRAAQEVLVPAGVRSALRAWTDHRCSTPLPEAAPLFVSQQGTRLCTRSLRLMFASVQERAGLERRFTFHHLRHSFCTDLYLHANDLRLVQRAARHARIDTTVVYTHPPDERLLDAVEGLDAARREQGQTSTMVTTSTSDHFAEPTPLTFPNLVRSESAPGTQCGNFPASENSTSPLGTPRPPGRTPPGRRPRRVSARADTRRV